MEPSIARYSAKMASMSCHTSSKTQHAVTILSGFHSADSSESHAELTS